LLFILLLKCQIVFKLVIQNFENQGNYLHVNIEIGNLRQLCVLYLKFIIFSIFVVQYLIHVHNLLVTCLIMFNSSSNVYCDSLKLLDEMETLSLATKNCDEDKKIMK
jgi:hypothetical protein